MDITVDKIRKLDGSGNLRAFVSVTIGGTLTIHSLRIIQQPGQKAWVSLPQREWTTPQEETRFAPLIELPEKVKNAIEAAVLNAWEQQQ